MGFKIGSHCVEKKNRDMGKCRSGVTMPEWNFNILVCNIYCWSLLLQIQSLSINYHSLLKWLQILINNSLKDVHAVTFKSVVGIELFSGVYPIP